MPTVPANAPPLPRSPFHATSRMVFASSALLLLMAVHSSSLFYAALAAFLFWSGWRVRVNGAGAVRTHAALQALTRGQTELAEAHLDAIKGSVARRGSILRSIAFQRALIAFYRGEASRAIDLIGPALAARKNFATHDSELVQQSMLLSLRALVRASTGDSDGAQADANEVFASSHAIPEALARARLAEAVVLSRRGALDELASHLRAHGSLMLEHALPRDRVLCRALRKLVQSRKQSVYRELSKPSAEVPTDALGSWIAQIAPEVAGFTGESRFAGHAEEIAIPQPTPEAMRALAKSRKAARNDFKAQGGLRGGKAMLLAVIGFGLLGAGLGSLQPALGWHPSPASSAIDPTIVIGGGLGLVVALGAIAVGTVSARRNARLLFTARRAVATGDMEVAGPLLDRLAKSRQGLWTAQAFWLRALHAESFAHFDECVTLCDRALASIQAQVVGMRAAASLDLTPSVLTLRALALAARGLEKEANAELATIATNHPTFALRAATELRVRLVAAVRGSDHEAARAIARSRTPELAITVRDEVLADLVLALSPEGASHDEQKRVDAELRDDAAIRAWVEAVAPGMSDDLARRVAGGGLRVAAPLTEVHDEILDEPIAADESRGRLAARLNPRA